MKLSKILALFVAIALISQVTHARYFYHKEHHIGPTGIRGKTSANNIVVEKVDEGSPADGKLNKGDEIVGANGKAFEADSRLEIANAIDQAETEAAGGKLSLMLKDGKTVDLQLQVLGTYSETTPYNCPKTDKIITNAADYVIKHKKLGRHDMNIGLLGLLATGEQKYVDFVKQTIHESKWAKQDIDPLSELEKNGRHAWGWAYTNLLLTEYYLLTGDDYVLPAIKKYTEAIATGRDAGGLWGHGMAYYEPNRGQKHGRLNGYAHINQSSITLLISVLLAEKCGVKHPEVQACIEQTHRFFNDFVGKGALPYGVHEPKSHYYNNNGTSASAAIAFAIKGNKKGADFYAKSSLASYRDIEKGHTGHYFGQLWSPLGANLAGPEATKGFFKKTLFLHTLNRTWQGDFTYDGGEGPKTHYSYRGLSDAGSHLLAYCLGRRKLYITGKGADQSLWLKASEAKEVVNYPALDFKAKSDEELITLFGHQMPQIRRAAYLELRGRDHKQLANIREMVRSGTKNQKISACNYFSWQCPKEQAVPAFKDMAALIKDKQEDPEVRSAASFALCMHGEAGYKYYNDMLRAIVEDKPHDPLQIMDFNVGWNLTRLCDNPYKANLVTDKKLFYAAALKMMDHPRHQSRAAGTKLVQFVPIEDLHIVVDKMLYVANDTDLNYHSYHGMGHRGNVFIALANLNIKEGLDMAIELLESPHGRGGAKIRMMMEVVPNYGANAKPHYDLLKGKVKGGRFQRGWDRMLKSIEEDENPKKMITLEEAIRIGKEKSNK